MFMGKRQGSNTHQPLQEVGEQEEISARSSEKKTAGQGQRQTFFGTNSETKQLAFESVAILVKYGNKIKKTQVRSGKTYKHRQEGG
jgi:hypothetical protein